MGGTERLNLPPNGKSVPPTDPPQAWGELNVPPTGSIVGGISPCKQPNLQENQRLEGKFCSLSPPNVGGDNTFFMCSPPKWRDDARFWLPASLGGKCLFFLGGKRVNFPPNWGGSSPPISPPTFQKTIDLQVEMNFCPPQLGGMINYVYRSQNCLKTFLLVERRSK